MDLFWMTQSIRGSARYGGAAASDEKAQNAVSATRRLEDRLNQLTLVNMALWSLLKEKTGLSEEDLIKRVEEIDLTDGRLDGKVTETVRDCPRCQRTLSQKHDVCLYCGFDPGERTAFDKVV